MDRYTSEQYQAKKADDTGFIQYTTEDHQTWEALYNEQIGQVNRHMANEYLEGLAAIDLPNHRIPQCNEVSDQLNKSTGWEVVPVPALIGYDRFFKLLSEKKFPAASFIRSKEDFKYVKEPDIFHEIFGHTPLLTNPIAASFSQHIGQLGTRCDKSDHVWLARLYWFTIEFGLIKAPNGEIKPLGSGLASSPSELQYAACDEWVERKPFDILEVLRTPYRIDIKQPIYFVLDGLDQLTEIMKSDIMFYIKMARSQGLKAPHPLLKQAS